MPEMALCMSRGEPSASEGGLSQDCNLNPRPDRRAFACPMPDLSLDTTFASTSQ